LLASVTLVTLLAAGVAGALSRRRCGSGVGFILVVTGLATAAAVLRLVATPSDAIPGVVSAVVAITVEPAAGSDTPTPPPVALISFA